MMALMVMMMMRMMSRFLSQKEVAWWSVSLGTHCHYLLSISITLKTIRKKMAQKLLIVFIISTPGLKLSLDLVLLQPLEVTWTHVCYHLKSFLNLVRNLQAASLSNLCKLGCQNMYPLIYVKIFVLKHHNHFQHFMPTQPPPSFCCFQTRGKVGWLYMSLPIPIYYP